jgi:hypothetical protein
VGKYGSKAYFVLEQPSILSFQLLKQPERMADAAFNIHWTW